MLLSDLATTGRPGIPRRAVLRRALAVVGAATAGIVLVTGQAAASTNPGAAFVAAANQARAAVGLPGLSVSADLSTAATNQARNMADADALFHTPNLGSGLCCWVMVGENVGEGASESMIEAAFMASPEHRANILRAAFTQIGVGYVIDKHGTLWVSEVFRRPTGSTAPVAPVAPKVTKVTPRAVVAAPRRMPVIVHVQRPPLAAVAATPAVPVSRSLARLPLAEAERLTAQFGVGEEAVSGTDPVSRLLDFAAKAAGSD
ncbi:MAG TPA: CAP domain-containing protein [Acidothermaceae bacterium]